MTARREEEYVEFVAARGPHLRRVAYAICGDWHQADDLLQTALVKLYVAWPRVRRDGREEAYTRRILVRAHIDETRRPHRRERPGLDGHDPAAPAGLPPEERDELVAALHALPLQQRRVVVLRHWLGLSVREAADELGISEGTVKSHSSRGLQALEAALTRT
ncbi:SigE family RNA polymerase sigma factor [Nocardioides solisilvae]|uniref:SigE family RNA polymerase sigma factor n=1 Tax=Nocardioides solisilvae TaxID=1542435 RepID=UPI000D74E4B4|nr:SigE family RNA polymerase sigma factor [Nocardioides solisilvae]